MTLAGGTPHPSQRIIDKRIPTSTTRVPIMDKKAKKRLDVINKKLQTLRTQLAGSRAQADDLDELKQLEDEIAKLETEAAELKSK